MILQILKHVEHGLIEAPTIGHAGEAVSRQGGIILHILIKFCKSHACIGLCGSMGMYHVEMGRKGRALAHEVPDLLCCLAHILGSLITIGGIVEHAVFKHVVLKIGRIEFGHKGAVHIEGGDAVFRLDEVGRVRIGHILHIVLQGRQCRAIVPLGEIGL